VYHLINIELEVLASLLQAWEHPQLSTERAFPIFHLRLMFSTKRYNEIFSSRIIYNKICCVYFLIVQSTLLLLLRMGGLNEWNSSAQLIRHGTFYVLFKRFWV